MADIERQSEDYSPWSSSNAATHLGDELRPRDVLSSSSSVTGDDTEKSPFLSHEHENDDATVYQRRNYRASSWRSSLSAAAGFAGALIFFTLFFALDSLLPNSSHAASARPTLRVDETMPSTSRRRDSSQYVLDSSWDFTAARTVREYSWTIRDAVFNPDGIFRPMILINNQFPGPLVECNEGDTIVVRVRNEAVNATAIHFHGMYQNGTNSMDGTVGITQCPIAPDTTFTYRFTVQSQSGTYWYHAHHSVQSSDGLLGPMVVHSREETDSRDYVSDRVIMVQDHYHNTSAELLVDYLQPDQENDEPVPSSGLINGRNHRDCSEFDGWSCENSASRLSALESLDLAPNQRHRLRFINTGAFAEFQVEVDEHPFHVTEVDGTAVHPAAFHRLNILPAQRYSVVVDTNVTSGGSFWLRARMITHCFARENPRLDPEVRAVVRYSRPDQAGGTSGEEPASRSWDEAVDVDCRDMDTTALRPVEIVAAPDATASMFLRANFEIGAWRLSRGMFNKSSWHGNISSPTLFRIAEAAQTENKTALPDMTGVNTLVFNPETEFVYQTTGIQTVDIIISNFDDGAHPFHLHGHKFFVLKQSPTGYPPESTAELERELAASGALENPLRRDTVTVQGYGWAVVRAVLDNAGAWALHCHNAWHGESGMKMAVAARVETARGWEVAREEARLCELPGIERGARPDDGIWAGNFG